MLNATPEPGTTDDFKEYLLWAPPEVNTPREAIAWSFGIDDPEEYAPAVET